MGSVSPAWIGGHRAFGAATMTSPAPDPARRPARSAGPPPSSRATQPRPRGRRTRACACRCHARGSQPATSEGSVSHRRGAHEVVGEPDVHDAQDRPRARRRASAPRRASARRRSPSARREPPHPPRRRSPRSRRRGCRRPRSARRLRSGSRSPPPTRPPACHGTPSRRSRRRRRPRGRAPAGDRARRRSERGSPGTSSSRSRSWPPALAAPPDPRGGPRSSHPPATELPRGHQPVSPVVPLSADHDRSPTVGAPASSRAARATARPARSIRTSAGTPRACVSRSSVAGLLRGEDRLHRTAIANATAFVFSWVNVISTSVTPRASARRFALPSSRIAGAPDGCRVTLMSCHRRPR